MSHIRMISPQELELQRQFGEQVRDWYESRFPGRSPLGCVRTFGCQQNVADSERIKGC